MTLNPAVFAKARVGNTRLGYASLLRLSKIVLTIASVDRSKYYDRETMEIIDDLNEQPNLLSFDCFGFTPANNDAVRLVVGSQKEFEGTITSTTEHHDRLHGRTVYRVTCTDYTRQFDALLVTKAYGSQSASDTAADIVQNFSSGFTGHNISPSLPNVAAIQFKMTRPSSALRQLCDAIGGDAYVDYDNDVHVFLTETSVVPDTLSTSTKGWYAFKIASMIERVANRIFVEGMGTTIMAPCAAGETIMPVITTDIFSVSGGSAVVQNQILTHAGVQAGGGGSLIGTGASPAAAPAVAIASGSGLGTGVYQYAYTDVTASGESLPSPLGSVTLGGTLTDPSTGPNVTFTNAGGGGPYPIVSGGTYQWAYTFITASGETLPTPVVSATPSAGGPYYGILFNIAVGGAGTTGRKIYRTVNGGAQLKLVGTIADNTTTTYDDHIADGSLGANVPTSNTAVTGTQASVSGIAIGASPTTSRKLYRTAVGGSQLKLLTTIADNTTTTYADSTADGSLGANAPTSDTSGLTQPTGQILAGATTLLVAGAGAFSASGGWAIIGAGQQLVRYTGISGNTLTGVPASGVGAISATVAYNTTITAAPALTGIPASGTGAIVDAIANGDEINILIQRDDATSQSTYGVRQAYVQDRRLSQAGAQARGDAELTLRKDPYVEGSYITLDKKVRSGRRVTISMLTEWGISATYTISKVRVFWPADKLFPQREVTFSSNAGDADLYRVLRRIREQQDTVAA